MEDPKLTEMLMIINLCNWKKRVLYHLLPQCYLISVVRENGCLWRGSMLRLLFAVELGTLMFLSTERIRTYFCSRQTLVKVVALPKELSSSRLSAATRPYFSLKRLLKIIILQYVVARNITGSHS